MSGVARVRATKVSPVVVGLTIRESYITGLRVGSEKSFIAHGEDRKWDFISSEGSWNLTGLGGEAIIAVVCYF